ncbi:MAG TPA: hypothetical protein VHV10_10030 [Ktedonobacteraceae bacterium]|jgi:hypothetical protein|nr:hypothetical protein [Ktedonobacteraceae bacterium]
MRKQPDEVFLAKGVLCWPVELAEEILAKPLPWGPPIYGLGSGYVDDPTLPDQSGTFYDLAVSVNGYDRHGDGGVAWASPIEENIKTGGSYAEISTQDLLDIVFFYCRGERFCDGLIRSVEPLLRIMIQEVVQRVRSETPPTFIPQGLDQTDNQ